MVDFEAVAEDVHVLRYPVLDVNCSLVLGRDAALLVDTLSCAAQARELAAAVRRRTELPVAVVNTHHHFDHVFGNHTIARELDVVDLWAHEHAIAALRDAAGVREAARRECRELAPRLAAAVGTTTVLAPNRGLRTGTTLDLGGRSVRLWHPGPAHTTGDVVVFADGVTIAGDLVEQSGPPSVEPDSDVTGWCAALAALLPRLRGPVIPGHGAVVDAAFVERQRRLLSASRPGGD